MKRIKLESYVMPPAKKGFFFFLNLRTKILKGVPRNRFLKSGNRYEWVICKGKTVSAQPEKLCEKCKLNNEIPIFHP